ncbi:unnamed protein product [Cylicostephanus goldi]|uniref:Uncharacterized protein n=1 Tax=Cylicostephanus goldi TaxID=71465 RepID=A0A3P7MTW9_CYLGO|nr:unnamed protein product [Cylicostephanus goldi]
MSNFRKAWTHFRPLEEWKTDVDEIVELFTNSQSPVNFVAWLASRYIGEPDHVLHTHGFYNGEYEAMMRKLDILFGYFAERMKASGLEDKVNIIFTADHGHTQLKNHIILRRFTASAAMRKLKVTFSFILGGEIIATQTTVTSNKVMKRAVQDDAFLMSKNCDSQKMSI